MKWAASLILPLLLASCETQPHILTPQERAVVNGDRCRMMGAKTQDQMLQCQIQLEQSDMQRIDQYQANRQAQRSAAFSNFGNAILADQARQQHIQQMNRPKTTTCNQYGRQVVCNTF